MIRHPSTSSSVASAQMRSPSPQQYPLVGPGWRVALVAAAAVGLLLWSFTAALAAFVVPLAVTLVWRSDEPPAASFALFFQWPFIVTGFFFLLIVGYYPGIPVTAKLETAIVLSLFGLLVIAGGFRFGRAFFERLERDPAALPSGNGYSIRRLSVYVIAVYAVNWLLELSPLAIWPQGAQVLHKVLEFRSALLLLLFLVVLEQRRHYAYALFAFLVVVIPEFTSMFAGFMGSFFLLLLALLAYWRPWLKTTAAARLNARIEKLAGLSGLCLFLLLLLWEGGYDSVWRQTLASGLQARPPLARLEGAATTAWQVASELSTEEIVERIGPRLSSSTAYFSYVLERVPSTVPHEGGRLTWQAIHHVLTPRLLFPDKVSIGNDSWLVQQYAGIPVAGPERGTSVGLGYMIEFYIDYGRFGMFIPLLFYGFLLGALYPLFRQLSPSRPLHLSVVSVLVLDHLWLYEAASAKILGSLLMSAAVFAILLLVGGRWLHNNLRHQQNGRPL